jgi:hypothetical protein
MGMIEDVRKLLQDLVTPDLKELQAQVKALADETNRRFGEVDRRFDAAEKLAAERHQQVMNQLRTMQDIKGLWDAVHSIQERLAQPGTRQ